MPAGKDTYSLSLMSDLAPERVRGRCYSAARDVVLTETVLSGRWVWPVRTPSERNSPQVSRLHVKSNYQEQEKKFTWPSSISMRLWIVDPPCRPGAYRDALCRYQKRHTRDTHARDRNPTVSAAACRARAVGAPGPPRRAWPVLTPLDDAPLPDAPSQTSQRHPTQDCCSAAPL